MVAGTRQGRSWHAHDRAGRRADGAGRRGAGAVIVALGAALLLAACSSGTADPEDTAGPGTADPGTATTAEPTTPDPALTASCGEFWGDPDYTDPLSRTVLDRAGTAPEAGPSDPFFYAMTGDDVEAAFESAPEDARAAATTLAEWFRTEPEEGADLDRDGFRTAWGEVAGQCASVSEAASWAAEPGEDGTKPATLVCADVFDTPGTLTHFANANVLTSNMFKLVGLSPRAVPADRMDDVQATADLLAAEIEAVDDDGVRAALEQVRAPFQDALDGDTSSEGLREPLAELGTSCDTAGYSSPEPTEGDDGTGDEGDEGLV
ncbi:hypothetical protein ACFQS2_16330 [Brachybacterium sp. GCM10030267]|uniref:hypothetical protein n=1 Tax=Brachybacterium sp. GCM10030267 TaxID=3273381 RepID=UPI0036153EFD